MQISLINPNHIIEKSEQTRSKRDDKKMEELKTSIKELGILEPLIVTESTERKGHYDIIAGRRRLNAALLLQLKEVPCIIRELKAAEKLDIEIAENLQREKLSLLDEAEIVGSAFATSKSILKVAQKLSKSIEWANTRHLISKLPEDIKQAYRDGRLTDNLLFILSTNTKEELAKTQQDLKENPEGKYRAGRDVGKELKYAKWDLDDANLLPNKPACTACPFNTSCTDLFDENKGVCLDSNCYNDKANQYLVNFMRAMHEKVGASVIHTSWNENKAKELAKLASTKDIKFTVKVHPYSWNEQRLVDGDQLIETVEKLRASNPGVLIGFDENGTFEAKWPPSSTKKSDSTKGKKSDSADVTALREAIAKKEENLEKYLSNKDGRELEWLQKNMSELVLPRITLAKAGDVVGSITSDPLVNEVLTARLKSDYFNSPNKGETLRDLIIGILDKPSWFYGKDGKALLVKLYQKFAEKELKEYREEQNAICKKRKENANKAIKGMEISIKELEDDAKGKKSSPKKAPAKKKAKSDLPTFKENVGYSKRQLETLAKKVDGELHHLDKGLNATIIIGKKIHQCFQVATDGKYAVMAEGSWPQSARLLIKNKK